jgi:signal peptidase I
MSLFMLLSFSIYIIPRFGWRVDSLQSSSMSPLLKDGDVVITRPVEARSVIVGDIIVFHYFNKPDNYIIHRVVEIDTNPTLTFKTRGDANETADPISTPAQNLVGKLAFHAPLLGYMVPFLRTGWGLVVSLVIPSIVIFTVCLRSLRKELVKNSRKE